MAEPYPPTEPYDEGMLDVGDDNLVYWETRGNPDGKPARIVHGGPGSSCEGSRGRSFDPDRYRIVLFDQRGCGRSRPHASDPDTDLSTNTTAHLIEDIERLRHFLGVERWLVFGGSWGSTLGLAYAERHPSRVSEMVLFSVVTTGRHEVEWVTRQAGRLFPAPWARFREGVPEAERDRNLVDAYSRLLHDPDPAVREKAAQDWCDWEDAVVSLESDYQPNPRYDDQHFRMAFARIV